MTRKYYGYPGHLIVSRSCLFWLHTHVPGYCISTIGDYYPENKRHRGGRAWERDTIGCDRYLETFVFEIPPGAECAETCDKESHCEIDSLGYQTGTEADAGHEAMVQKYEAAPHKGEGSKP